MIMNFSFKYIPKQFGWSFGSAPIVNSSGYFEIIDGPRLPLSIFGFGLPPLAHGRLLGAVRSALTPPQRHRFDFHKQPATTESKQ